MKWETARLGDVTDSCLGKMLDQNKNRGTYQSYLANNNVRWGTFELDELSQMKFLDTEEERYGLKYGDLVICEGGEPGRCAIWKEQLPNMKIQKALHRVRAHDSLDIRFLYYWFLDAGRKGALDQYFTGATIKHMPGDKLKSIVIDKPPFSTQHKIADILSSYDDLIENNQKQIKLLEEAAQRLYKEWFVDLRFPGHEKTPIVDGVPEGWERKKIADVCQTIGGGTPNTKITEYYNGKIYWVTPTDITSTKNLFLLDTEKKITEEGLLHSSAKMLPPYTILMTSRASVGYFGLCEQEVCTNQGFISCVPNEDVLRYYLLGNLRSRVDEIRGLAGGTTYLEISKSKFRDMDICLPSDKILQEFHKQMVEIINLLKTKTLQISNLQEARDRLLPKLMSGEIEV